MIATSYDLWTEITPGVSRRDDQDSANHDRYTLLRTSSTLVRIDRNWGSQPVCWQGFGAGVRIDLPWPMTYADALAYWTLALIGEPTDLMSITSMREYLEQRAA